MKIGRNILILSALCSGLSAFPALASTNLETGSSLAGISVALNNYYAGNEEPEKKLAQTYTEMEAEEAAGGGAVAASAETAAQERGTAAAQASQESHSSAYDNIAVSNISGTVNIRTEANTSSAVTGKIYNDCAATILETVDGEGGQWYKIQSGSVTGYIKAEYFVTGEQAETRAKEVGTTYGTVVDTSSLRLRESPDLTSKTLTLLAEGAEYTVVGEEGDFLKVAVDTDLEGYVFKDYMKTEVSFREAVSLEEEAEAQAEAEERRKEAEDAMAELERAKEAAKKTTTAARETEPQTTQAAETTAQAETTKAETTTAAPETRPQVIEVNPETGSETTAAAPETEAQTERETTTEAETQKSPAGPGAEAKPDSGSSSEVVSATRNAIVAYAKQFLGNPYVYGGTSLTNGADCSGFVMSVYAHFGISTGRSARDQAAKGREIPVSEVKPGDLLFYASGNYINHVAIYVGGGQIIHSSTPATGICYAPSNYRTPCKAVTFLD